MVQWLVREGDRVEVGTELVELETEKAVFSVEAEQAGIVRRILVGAGQKLPVGTCLGLIAAEHEQLEPAAPSPVGTGETEAKVDIDGCAAEYLVDDYREALLFER